MSGVWLVDIPILHWRTRWCIFSLLFFTYSIPISWTNTCCQ